jgi:hypothetical protein
MPSGDINKDMKEIKLYFKDFKGKTSENFALWRALNSIISIQY